MTNLKQHVVEICPVCGVNTTLVNEVMGYEPHICRNISHAEAVEKIQQQLWEYADCHEELNSEAIAKDIIEIVRKIEK